MRDRKVYARLRCPKRVLIGPWTHNYPENAWPLPRINDRYECLRWFDRHLKGVDTDPQNPLDRGPPVTLFVREFTRLEVLRREDAGAFRAEADWPPAHVRHRALSLSADGRLAAPDGAVPGRSELVYRPDVGVAAGRYAIGQMLPGWGMGDDQRLDEALSLAWTSDPVGAEEGIELLGTPVAHLWVSSTAEVALLSVKLCDVSPDGSSALVTKSVLNLTHRARKDRPEPLLPGEVYALALPLQAIAHRFPSGHRLRLMVAAADFQNAWPTPAPHTLTVHRGPGQPSRLELPLAGPRDPALPEPRFQPSDFAPLPPEQITTPEYTVTRDLIENAVTITIRTLSGIGVNRSRYTIHVARPADSIVSSEFEYPLDRPGLAIRVRAHCVTRSDTQAFHHLTTVEVTVNDRPHWSKSWSLSMPRGLC